MNIVIVGHVCIDTNVSEHASYTSAGSPAMFMTKVFRQLPDTDVTIVSGYGADFLPYAKGITLYPTRPIAVQTLVYQNISLGKKRTQKAFHRNASGPVPLDGSLKKILKNADIVIFGPILPNFPVSYIQSVIDAANPEAITLLLPQGYFREFDVDDHVVFRKFAERGDLIKRVDFVAMSNEDYPDVEMISRRWARKSKGAIIITEGDKGAAIITQNGEQKIPTIPIPVDQIVDSIGSGDIFSAGFIYEYALSKDVKRSVVFANKLAGVCLSFTPENIRFEYKQLKS